MSKIIAVIKVYTNKKSDLLQTGVLWIAFILSVISFVLFCTDPHFGVR